MRILIDLQGAQSSGSRNRGIGRYSMSLAKAMVQSASEHEFWLLLNIGYPDATASISAAFKGLIPAERIVVFTPPSGAQELSSDSTWRTRAGELIRDAVIKKIKPDVVYVSSLFEGLTDDCVVSVNEVASDFVTVVTLYDLIPLSYPSRYLCNERVKSYYMRKIDSLSRADLLLGISAFSTEEALAAIPGMSREKVINISSAIDENFGHLSQDLRITTNRKNFGITRRFVMYTGGIDWRKNIEGLIKAYALLPADLKASHQLVLVCHIEPAVEKLLRALCRSVQLEPEDVVFTGFVSDNDLIRLYRTCALFVFPSLHEGFGLPVLEAMKCGAVVIGSNTSSIPEVIGNENALFDPSSEADIARLMARTLTDELFRNNLKRHAVTQLSKFSWKETAQRAMTAILEVHNRKRISAPPPTPPRRSEVPSLAMLTPIPPAKSGIADYSAELLVALAEHYDITVISNQDISNPLVDQNIAVRSVDWFRDHAKSFDRIVYQFGNSDFHAHMFQLLRDFPGVVVLHDFFLSGVLNWMESTCYAPRAFSKALARSHGREVMQFDYEQGRENTVQTYPCNRLVLERATGVIVHSAHSMQLADANYGEGFAKNWRNIPLLRAIPKLNHRHEARAMLGLAPDDILVCSFGHLAPSKLNDRLLRAWKKSSLSSDPKCRLVFVGQNDPGLYGQKMEHEISKAQIREQILITGFASTEIFETHLAAADIAIQLRGSSRGETSKAVLDCLSYGLPVVINANGSMAEYPNIAVCKLRDNFSELELVEAIELLKANHAERRRLSAVGLKFVTDRHDPKRIARRYKEAIEDFAQSSTNSQYWELIDSLAMLRGINSQDDLVEVSAAVAKNENLF
jgi:glycosyltransferase involved in cell wall biosynthesis